MKFKIAGAAMALLVFGLVQRSHACDCTLPVNYGNSQCTAAITAALNGGKGNANSNTNTQGQGQGQSQGINSSIGVGASSTVGNTSAAGGSVGNTTATGGTGGTSSATGGKGGKASATSTNTNAGGSVSGVSSTSAGGTASGGTATANGNGGSIGAGAGAASVQEGNTNIAASRIPVNTAIAGFQMTTAPCRYAEGLGIQTMPAGGAVGFTFKDHDCMKLGMAQEFYAHQQWEAGDRIMCAIKEVSSVLGKECLMILTAGHQVRVVVAVAPTVSTAPVERTYTRAEVDVLVRKAVSK